MLDEGLVTPNADISEADRQTIVTSVVYLNNMKYTEKIKWLSGYNQTYDFEKVFGFPMYTDTKALRNSTMVTRDQSNPLPVGGYDFVVHMNIYSNNAKGEQDVSYDINGKTYTLSLDANSGNGQEIILKEDQSEINRFAMKDIYNKFENVTGIKKTKDLTFVQDNSASTLEVIAENITVNAWDSGSDEWSEVYILVKIK
jgi:hypothetical protein